MGKSFSQKDLREKLKYDSETGLFYTLRKTARSAKGDVVSSVRKDGYRRVNVFGGKFLAHRLAWFYMFGVWPDSDIDHIDGDPSNNAFANLRVVTRSENIQNQRKVRRNSKTGINGICWDAARCAYRVQLKILGKVKCGGYFADIDDAVIALKALKAQWHPFSPINEEM